MSIDSKQEKEIIVSLLIEYSDKLSKISDEMQTTTDKYFLYTFLSFLVCFFGAIMLSNYQFKMSYLWFFPVIGYILILGSFILTYLPRIRTLKRQGKYLYNRLRKLIDLTSSMEANVISNQAVKIELDLRLADAESAIENYQEIIKKLKRLNPTSNANK